MDTTKLTLEAILSYRDAKGFDAHSLMSFREMLPHLIRKLKANKAIIQAAILDLSKSGKVSLHQHDWYVNLSAEDKERMIDTGTEAYVGLNIRRG